LNDRTLIIGDTNTKNIGKGKLITFLEENNKLLSKNQFGFRKGLGTIEALYNVSKCIYNALDDSRKAIVVFLDFAKAFDTIDHKQLLIALPGFGILSMKVLNGLKDI